MFRKIRARRTTKNATKKTIGPGGGASAAKSIFRKNASASLPTIQLSRTVSMSQDEMDDASIIASASPVSEASSLSLGRGESMGRGEILFDGDAMEGDQSTLVFNEKLQKNYEESLVIKDMQLHLTKKELMLAQIELRESEGKNANLIVALVRQQQDLEKTQKELVDIKEMLQITSTTLIKCQHDLFEKEEASMKNTLLNFWRA